MTLISNTGPLIALAKVDRLPLLQALFGKVLIPPAVHRELLAKSGVDARRLDVALAQFVHVTSRPTATPEVKNATAHLDDGEQEAIALAYTENRMLVIDERLGRVAARRLGITITGSAGILLEGKRRDLIPTVIPLLEEMRHRGYWLSDDLIALAARLADEAM